MPAKSIKGKTALVTGAAKRIGREISLALADEGVNVIVHYRTSGDDARTLVDELKSKGVKSWVISADFENLDETRTLIRRAIEMAGGLDILVNSASIFPTDTLDTLTFDSIVMNIEVNAWTPFALTRDFAAQVGRGSVVNLIDSRIKGEDWTHVGYILSKHMLYVLTRMAAIQYAPNIAVNGVAPGLILPPPGKPESYIDAMVQTVPLEKHGAPGDVAEAVVYLARSEFLTGEVIYVDGGRHLKEYTADRKG